MVLVLPKFIGNDERSIASTILGRRNTAAAPPVADNLKFAREYCIARNPREASRSMSAIRVPTGPDMIRKPAHVGALRRRGANLCRTLGRGTSEGSRTNSRSECRLPLDSEIAPCVDRRAAVFGNCPIEPTRSDGLVWQGPSPRVVPIPRPLRAALIKFRFDRLVRETNAGVDLCQAAVASRDSIAFNGSRSAIQPVERSPIAWPYL